MNCLERKVVLQYWKNKVRDNSVFKADANFYQATQTVCIGTSASGYLNRLTGGGQGVAVFTVLMALYNILLKRYFGDVVLLHGKTPVIGSGESLLYKAFDLSPGTCKDMLGKMKTEVQEVYQYAGYMADGDEAILMPEALALHTPYGLTYNVPSTLDSGNLFNLHISQTDRGYEMFVGYASTFSSAYLATHLLQNVVRWITDLDRYLDAPPTAVALLAPDEKEFILTEFSGSKELAVPATGDTLVELFECQVARTPDQVALVVDDKQYTYDVLNRSANCLARYVSAVYALQAGDFVAVKLARDQDLVIAILAVLKAGAAYVPVDVAYPSSRIEFIERDSRCTLVIDAAFMEAFKVEAANYSPGNPGKRVGAEELAYLIYTSGTSGNPKGVMISHGNAVALIRWAQEEFSDVPFNMVYATTSHCFDLSVYELFFPLSAGVPIRMLRNAFDIAEFLKKDTGVLLNTVPSVIKKLVAAVGYGGLGNVAVLNLAGEPFPPDIAQELARTIPAVRNLYGPSEDTTYSTVYRVQDSAYTNVPIGRPLPGTHAYILDEAGHPVPVGVMGKLYLSGLGLASGYFGQQELTSEKFIQNPFTPDQRMYDTGDLAYWLANGDIVYTGRNDTQVKLRGYRIELGEVDVAVSQFSDKIGQVVSDVRQIEQEQVLITYYERVGPVDTAALRAYLQNRLPDFMVPGYLVPVAALPLTPNGKIDRKALRTMDIGAGIRQPYVAPRNDLEKTLAEIWSGVLGMTDIGVHDHFFELGGHSLMVAQVMNQIQKRLDKTLSYKAFYEAPTIEALSHSLDDNPYRAISRAPLAGSYPLTPFQHQLWLLGQQEVSSQAYHISGALQLTGDIHVDRFKQALAYVFTRHEVFRTCFKLDDTGQVRQFIEPDVHFNHVLDIQDFSQAPDARLQVDAAIDMKLRRQYDFSTAGLYTASLFKVAHDQFVFFLSVHHIICDGWSLEILTTEVMTCYNQLQREEDLTLPPLSLQFKDYAVWLQEQDTRLQAEDKAYWVDVFQGANPILELPTFVRRPLVKTYAGNVLSYVYGKEMLNRLKTFAGTNQVTLYTLLMASVNVLLAKYSNQYDVIVGLPMGGREHPDLENQVGLYLNTLAIRTKIDKEKSLQALLHHQQEVLRDAYAHAQFSVSDLVKLLPLKYDISRSPLFDVMVVLQSQQQVVEFINKENFEGFTVAGYRVPRRTAQFDLSFEFIEAEDLSLHLTYNTDIYDEFIIDGIFRHLTIVFEQFLTTPDRLLTAVSLVADQERVQVVRDFNATAVRYPSEQTLGELFGLQAKATPDAPALIYEDQAWSYRQLDEVSNELANWLLSHCDLKAEDAIGVKLDRSEWPVICFLSILKAGCAYVPIDLNYPPQRIAYLEESSGCRVVIDDFLLELFTSSERDATVPQGLPVHADSLAYIMYTSGSTGNPKGILVPHRGVVRLVMQTNYTASRPGDRFLGLSSFSFDGSTFDIYAPLLNGGTLVVGSRESILAADRLNDLIISKQVNSLYMPTALFNSMIEAGVPAFSTLKQVVIGGEQASLQHVRHFKTRHPAVRLTNGYGPTENTTFSVCYDIDAVPDDLLSVPIGSGIANSTCYVLDDALQPVPIGVIGEICVGGAGVARGYLDTALTAERFVADPFVPGGRLYKTGDLGKWLPNGIMVCTGRKDDQVKIRGYRVQPGEIENALLACPLVQQAVVYIHQEDAGPALVAYLVPAGELDKLEVRRTLQESLPEYMVPAYFVVMDEIPLTVNGKVDKAALPPVNAKDMLQGEYVAPRTDTEARLVLIWQQVLALARVGVTDNFFEIGGHSLMMEQVINQVQKQLGKELSYQAFYEGPTIEQVSLLLEAGAYCPIENAPLAESYPLTSSQHRLWLLSQHEASSRTYHISGALRLSGNVVIDRFKQALAAVLARHDVFRTCFKMDDQGRIRQFIEPEADFRDVLEVHDFSDMPAADRQVAAHIDKILARKFDLSTARLYTVSLFKMAHDQFVFFLSVHHIICDGWSLEILTAEVMVAYNRWQQEQRESLPALTLQFKDYVAWLSQREDQQKEADKAYWLNVFQGEIPILELPTFVRRPLVKTYAGAELYYTFPEDMLARLKVLAGTQQTTLYTVLMASVNILLAKYASQYDVIVGMPVAGREHPDLENQVGLYLNTLAIRTKIDPEDSIQTFLQQQKTVLRDAYAHQHFPLDELVASLPIKNDVSRSPLFDVMVVLQNQQQVVDFIEKEQFQGVTVSGYPVHRQTAQYDLSFEFRETDGLTLALAYNTAIYDEDIINGLFRHLNVLFEQFLNMPEASIQALSLVQDAERTTVLESFNATGVAYPSADTLGGLFTAQATATPEAVALLFEDRAWCYRQLDEVSNALANWLLSRYTLAPEDAIGVKLERSDWSVICFLGILKAGCAYVPIDLDYPSQRIAYLEETSRCRVVIEAGLLEDFKASEQLVAPPPARPVQVDSLAYIMYTSGSTGKPKGILITHRGVIRLVKNTNYVTVSPGDRYLGISSFSFDGATFDIYMPLLNGGALVVGPKEQIIVAAGFNELIESHQIDSFYIPTALFNSLVEAGVPAFGHLKHVLTGGEQASIPHFKRFRTQYPQVKLSNVYGPTENTTFSTFYEIGTLPGNLPAIPIGAGIANSTCYILDDAMQPVPVGVIGEICLGGAGVARGYLDGTLTADRFVADPFTPGNRLYKTGDLGKWLPEGVMVFTGRKDNQVKIRGYLVQPGEIENALLACPPVQQAVVLIQQEETGPVLVAYLVSAGNLDKQGIRHALQESLPAYMVPTYFVTLDEIPLTVNGKVDKQALPPAREEDLVQRAYVAPRTPVEEQLVLIWQEVLGLDRVGVTDNFFEIGGHSLKAMTVLSLIHQKLGVHIKAEKIFHHPSIDFLAMEVENSQWLTHEPEDPNAKKILI